MKRLDTLPAKGVSTDLILEGNCANVQNNWSCDLHRITALQKEKKIHETKRMMFSLLFISERVKSQNRVVCKGRAQKGYGVLLLQE